MVSNESRRKVVQKQSSTTAKTTASNAKVTHLPSHLHQVCTSLRSPDDQVNRLALQRVLHRDLTGSSGQQKELNEKTLRHTLAQKHTGGGSMREDVSTDGLESASRYESHGRSRIG